MFGYQAVALQKSKNKFLVDPEGGGCLSIEMAMYCNIDKGKQVKTKKVFNERLKFCSHNIAKQFGGASSKREVLMDTKELLALKGKQDGIVVITKNSAGGINDKGEFIPYTMQKY